MTYVREAGGGGTYMLRHTGMCRPNGLIFHQKSLDMGPILVKKIPRGGSHFTKFAKKNGKISRFWGRKPLEMGLDLRKLPFKPFLSEKNP